MFLRCSYFLAKSEADVLKNGVRSTCRRRPHLVYTIPTFVLSPNSTGLNIWIGWNLGFRGGVELGGRDVTQSSLSVASHEKMPKHMFT